LNALAENLAQVQNRIAAAARRAGREPEQVTLVAVTKTHPVEVAGEAYQTGLRHFGENRPAEGYQKISDFGRMYQHLIDTDPVQWHFIGHIQSRQAGEILSTNYDLLHSVDSVKLAERLNRLIERDDLNPINILLQCNVSGESSKSGFTTDNWEQNPDQLQKFSDMILNINNLTGVNIRGLMTMAPIVGDPEETRSFFSKLFRLSERLKQDIPQIQWKHLSMGMTDDFEIAIEEGATIVRVGRAIFGERSKQ
jgi:pyridoxal phosphate enzyme (YggS family)